MAIKSGFRNFVDFSYARLGRIDYTPTDVSCFKFNISKYITPLLKKIKTNNNHQNLVKYYNDEWYNIPCYAQITADNIINIIEKILKQLSNDAAVDFQTMYQSGLIDVEQRDTKVNYNFCTSFQGQRMSAILMNLTGSIKDIDTIMHEFGHALANKYMFDREDSEIGLGGRETMEAHALIMELFGAILMDEFFDEETNSFKRKYIINALNTLVYSAVVDDFQVKIYNHPNASVDEWNAFYLESEKKYRPYLDYSNITYLEEGTKWQLQSHIFEIPFYYIEYGLAQVMALSFWSQIKNDYKKAFQKFSEFLKQSGTLPLDKLIESNSLFSPFDEKSFQKTISFFNSKL